MTQGIRNMVVKKCADISQMPRKKQKRKLPTRHKIFAIWVLKAHTDSKKKKKYCRLTPGSPNHRLSPRRLLSSVPLPHCQSPNCPSHQRWPMVLKDLLSEEVKVQRWPSVTGAARLSQGTRERGERWGPASFPTNLAHASVCVNPRSSGPRGAPRAAQA